MGCEPKGKQLTQDLPRWLWQDHTVSVMALIEITPDGTLGKTQEEGGSELPGNQHLISQQITATHFSEIRAFLY